MDTFERTILEKAFDVSSVITVHYFEHDKNYIFEGESHDFWEMVYADRGDVLVYFNDTWQTLKAGCAIFHKPMQFHNIKADGHTSPNVIVISFECFSKSMEFFNDRIFHITHKEKKLITKIISYSKRAFTTRLDDPYTKKLVKSGDIVAEQYIGLYLENLLLSFYCSDTDRSTDKTDKLNCTNITKGSIFDQAVSYMHSNINKNLTIHDICSALHISAASLKRVFMEYTGLGIITYFRNMRIEHAKTLIRESGLNMTQIAEQMGYDSIHYFSTQFKNIVGMSPREYSLSIKMWIDNT